MTLAWLAVVTLLPSPDSRDRSNRPRTRWLEPLLRCNLSLVERHGKAIILVGVYVTAASIVAIPYLRFETNPLGYFPSDARVSRDFSTIDARLTGTLPFQITVTGQVDPTEMLRSTNGEIRMWVEDGCPKRYSNRQRETTVARIASQHRTKDRPISPIGADASDVFTYRILRGGRWPKRRVSPKCRRIGDGTRHAGYTSRTIG